MIHLDTMRLLEDNVYWLCEDNDPGLPIQIKVYLDDGELWFEEYGTSFCYSISDLNNSLPLFDTLQEYADYYFPEERFC